MSWADRSGWMAIDGTEIINTMRTAAYARSAGCNALPSWSCMPCEDLFYEVSDPPYVDPSSDDAPWYDPGIPTSQYFFGVAGIDILGIANYPDTTDRGKPVRDVAFNVLLVGRDEASLSYGMSWLSVALKGSFCRSGSCTGGQMCVAVSCPTTAAPDPVRMLYDISIVDRPDLVEVIRRPTYTMWRVTFTLRASIPELYSDPASGAVLSILPSGGVRRMIDLPATYELCEDPVPCGQDPECPRPEIPIVPQPPLDACYPSDPFPGRRTVAQIESLNIPQWIDMVPVVTIQTADLPMRNITVRFYINALGMPCDEIIANVPCTACFDVTISYLPPNSTTEVDGRVRRARTRCISPTGEDVDIPPLYGPAGQMFVWPEFACGYGLCVEVTTHEDVSPEATIQVSLHARQEAA